LKSIALFYAFLLHVVIKNDIIWTTLKNISTQHPIIIGFFKAFFLNTLIIGTQKICYNFNILNAMENLKSPLPFFFN
jgi:hypothetical protein